MGQECSTHGKYEKFAKNCCGNIRILIGRSKHRLADYIRIDLKE
jgi:hypothetical protein